MTESLGHPPLDLLADHAEGVLSAETAMQVNAHLVGCVDCRDTVDALVDVRSILRSDGTEPLPMPDDVAVRIHQAVDAESQYRASVVDFSTTSSGAQRHRRRTSLAVAAAVVGVLAIGSAVGAAVLLGGDDQQTTGAQATPDEDDSGGGEPPSGDAAPTVSAKPTEPGGISAKPTLSPIDFGALAGDLVQPGGTPRAESCLAEAIPAYDASTWSSRAVQWGTVDTEAQLVTVDPTTYRGYVVDCSASPPTLTYSDTVTR